MAFQETLSTNQQELNQKQGIDTENDNDPDLGPVQDYKRWLSELEFSKQSEKDWNLEAKDVWNQYKIESKKSDYYNVLYSNTEILRQATYNTLPRADVRQRWTDQEDPVGSAVARVTSRACNYELEYLDANDDLKGADIDHLVCGRGVIRVKYEPTIVQEPVMELDPSQPMQPGQPPPMRQAMEPDVDEEGNPLTNDDGTPKMKVKTSPRKVSDSTPTQRVHWEDFRRGPGKTWKECPWVAFRHHLYEKEAADMFGVDIATHLDYSEIERDTAYASKEKEQTKMFKTAQVWEIWCKISRCVYFVAESYEGYLKDPIQDPLHLQDFFPCPRPLYWFENTIDLTPIPPFRSYKEQALELNRVSSRLNKLMTAFRVRGAYMQSFDELSRILSANDNDMVPVANQAAVAAAGGLDSAIWFMPLDKLAGAITQLITYRQEVLQAIYQITGISDILRASSDPRETATAVSIKTQWGSLRLQRVQREVQRFCRDVIRIKCEIMSEHYDVVTYKQITGLNHPDMPTQGQVSWKEIMDCMRSDLMRSYHIDIETDSTIHDFMDTDIAGLAQVIQAIAEFMQQVGPLVQSGAIPFPVAKEILMTIIRKSQMGPAVEDQISQMQPPQPPPPPTEEQTKQLRGAKDAFIKVAEEHTLQVQQQVQQAATLAQTAQGHAAQAEVLHQEVARKVGEHQVNQAHNQALQAALAQLGNVLAGQNAQTQTMVADALNHIHRSVTAPKVVSLHKDGSGKVIGASALPALPPPEPTNGVVGGGS